MKAYKDSRSLWTIGYGHFITPGDGFNKNSVIDRTAADNLFEKDYQNHKDELI